MYCVGRGVVERIRISNPTKIDIKVKFKILSPEAAAAADKRPKSGSKGKAAPAKGGKGNDSANCLSNFDLVFLVVL